VRSVAAQQEISRSPDSRTILVGGAGIIDLSGAIRLLRWAAGGRRETARRFMLARMRQAARALWRQRCATAPGTTGEV
jgi:hypothetical protein